jgi:putative transposase
LVLLGKTKFLWKGAYTPMRRVIPITEQFEHFLGEVKENFWGDLYKRTLLAWEKFLTSVSMQERDRYLGVEEYERAGEREHRNGVYERSLVTVLGTLKIQVARTRGRSFLPQALARFQRRAPEVMLLIREAFLRGLSTRQVGRVVGIVSEKVSAQTVSRLTRTLDHLVKAFHTQRLKDEWAYLFLDGVSLRVRRPSGRQRVQMLVAYGVRADGSRQLLAFLRSQGESQAAWEGLLQDLYRRGLEGKHLLLIVTDGCPGLAAALQTVYPRVPHQRCWVHKMRNILEKVRKRDYAAVKKAAQAIYLAPSQAEAVQAFRVFGAHWQPDYPTMVKRLEQDLPELLSFFRLPRHLWRKLRTTNVIERCFVEVRRRTRPMVCFVNEASVDRIIFSIFSRFNEDWRNRILRLFTQAA